MKSLFIAIWAVLLGAGLSSAVCAPTHEQLQHGQKTFDYWCAPCHGREPREGGRYLPGTASLKAKYGNDKPAALEDRTDLAAEFTKVIIRRGVAGMPSFRKTEISDSDMEDIAAYLARNTH